MENKESDIKIPNSDEIKFMCPNDGEISQDDVVFLCNKCGRDKLLYKSGVYICPECLDAGENFQCMLCDSKEVEMKFVKQQGTSSHSSS